MTKFYTHATYINLVDDLNRALQLVYHNEVYTALVKTCLYDPNEFYGCPYGFLTAEIQVINSTTSTVFVCVHSIDDVSVPLLGPHESPGAAQTRFGNVLQGIQAWAGYLPSQEDLEVFCYTHGLYLNA